MLALLVPLLVILLVVAFIIGWSLLFGWLLSLIIALTLFEGALLVMLATFATAYAMLHYQADTSSDLWFDDDDDDEDFYQIKPDRFVKSSAERTWENWMRYEIANAINIHFAETDLQSETVSEQDLREIAIRLADVTIAAVKRRSPRTHPLRLTPEQLTSQMRHMELQPYDNDIISEASAAINLMLSTPMVTRVVREELWDDRTPFDFTS